MFANSINVLALATVAANLVPAALAAPAPASTVNNAIPHSVNPVTQDVIEERGAGVKIGSALAGTLASLITGGVADHLFGRDVALKLGESGISLMIGDDGTVYANTSEGQGVSKRGWAAIGKAVAGGVASGAAASILNNLFGRDAALMVGEDGTAYMVDDDGTIYANLPEEQGVSKRAVSPALGKALGAIGTAVAGGLASGASEASISEIFHKFNTRDMEVEEKRAFGAIISILQNLFHKREEEVSVTEKRSWAAIGKAVAGGVASGAAVSVLNNLVSRDAALMIGDDGNAFMVDDDGMIYANLPDEQPASKRDISATIPGLEKLFGRREVNELD